MHTVFFHTISLHFNTFSSHQMKKKEREEVGKGWREHTSLNTFLKAEVTVLLQH